MWFELGRGALQGCDKREQSHNKANQVQEHVQQDHSEDSLILQTGATGSAVMDHTQQWLFHHPGDSFASVEGITCLPSHLNPNLHSNSVNIFDAAS